MLPTGTVTFLLTDVEGSTRSWEAAPDAMAKAIARHYELIDAAVAAHDGARPEEQGEGDSVVAAFWSASDGIAAALDLQRAIAAEPWPGELKLRVRIGVHTGEARLRDDRNYTGAALHRCARLRDIGHGGQTLVTSVTAALVTDALPSGAWLADLGAHRLRDLSRPEHVFELHHADLGAEFGPLRSLDVLANNLPAQLTSFVGRAGELAEVKSLLADGRLVTLTGSGGCGKTRLAVQAAAAMADGWPDGVWWVDLGPVSDPDLVAELVASAIRVIVEPVGGPLRALELQLRDRRLLICLDNCEHLLDACAGLADTLLRACPDVTILATSREPLGVAGETVWRVPSMTEGEAVRLFAERAASAHPGFGVEGTNEDAVRTICRRLDGIPLAVELAAAWVRVLAPAQIAAGLDDRFRLLSGGPRGVTARQQTLAASVDWSHDLLDDADQAVFRRLGAFSGGLTLEAARDVCAGAPVDADDMLGALGRLVDKSLVLAQQHNGNTRYRLLETLRQYASDRLRAAGETAELRERHLEYFLAFAEAAEPELERADQDHWLEVLETEYDNVRTALDWGLSDTEPEPGRRLAAALTRLWLLHGLSHEGIGWLQRAIAASPDDRSRLQARLLVGVALVAAPAGQFSLIVESTRKGLDIAIANDDDYHRGRFLAISAYALFDFDFEATKETCLEAQRYAEAAGDAFGANLALLLEALSWTHLDEHEHAAPLFETLVERCRQRGDRLLGAYALAGQVYGELFAGRTDSAHRLAVEAVELATPLGDYFTLGQATANLGWVKAVMGDIDGGLALMETVVRSVEGAGPDVDVPMMAITSGRLRLWCGDLQGAIGWFERGVRYAEPMTDNLVAGRALPGLAAALRRAGRVDEARERVDQSIATGRKLGMPCVLAEALDESARLVASDDAGRAEDLHHDALAVRVDHNLRLCYVESLDALAHLAGRAESFSEATRLLAASNAAREEMGYPLPPVAIADHEATVASLRAALGDDDFAAAWNEGAELSLDDAVAYARRARGTRGRPSVGWASLTPTELNVVNLVVEGLANPEIAARLFISRATVKTHLSHIFTKVGVANRTELATLASTHASVGSPHD